MDFWNNPLFIGVRLFPLPEQFMSLDFCVVLESNFHQPDCFFHGVGDFYDELVVSVLVPHLRKGD